MVRAKVCTAYYLKRGSWEKNKIRAKPQEFLLTTPTISSRMVLRSLALEIFSGPPKGVLLTVCLLFPWTLLFFSPREGPADCCCGSTSTGRAALLLEGHGESPATCDCCHCPPPISCQTPAMQNSFLAPKLCQSAVITFCFSVIQVPSAQAGNEMVTVGWWDCGMEREPQKWLSTAGRG